MGPCDAPWTLEATMMLDSASYRLHDVVSWRTPQGSYLSGRVLAVRPRTFTVEYREPGPRGKVVTKRFRKPPWGSGGTMAAARKDLR